MWLTSAKESGRNNSAPLLEKECYPGEVQPHRKMDYKPMIYIIYNVGNSLSLHGLNVITFYGELRHDNINSYT